MHERETDNLGEAQSDVLESPSMRSIRRNELKKLKDELLRHMGGSVYDHGLKPTSEERAYQDAMLHVLNMVYHRIRELQ